ncbi:MAG: aminoglycoside phosphotransferase family protein [Chloroflexota bacterium]|nr:aminoglycoside phosphotransferase family protein [Chloroflexota bacterium]
MRDKPGISEEQLRVCLQEQYDLIAITLDFLPLGLDSRAGVYRMVSEHGIPYLLKARLGALYEPGCLVPRYLSDQGITAVVAPLSTKRQALWTQVQDWTVIVYPFIDGDTSWTGMTDEHWQELGTIFKRIHQVMPPPSGFASLRKETFDPAEYIRWVRAFEAQHLRARHGERDSERALRSSWMAHQHTIDGVVTALEKLAKVLQSRSGPHVICHADLHPANLIRDHAGHVFVIDWDDMMLAPKERDFLFVETPADNPAQQSPPPFFQGYGETEIDWTALAYYRYERVIQDVIAFAEEAFFRNELGEETRADAVRFFDENLSEGGEIDATYAAAKYVSSLGI